MPATDLALLTEAALAAGEIANRFFRAEPKVWDKADDAGPVTEADLAVDRMLHETLLAARPDYGWLSEETEDDALRLGTDHQFIIDPIDGTRSFIEGGKDWSHSLAIAGPAGIEAAVVHLPRRDLTFAAARGRGATLNGQAVTVATARPLAEAQVLAERRNWDDQHWASGHPPEATRTFRSSLAYRMCLVAQGRFDAMMTLRPTWEWDVAAGSLIVEEAGGRVSTRTGERPLWNNAHPQIDGILAGGPVQALLLERLAPRDEPAAPR